MQNTRTKQEKRKMLFFFKLKLNQHSLHLLNVTKIIRKKKNRKLVQDSLEQDSMRKKKDMKWMKKFMMKHGVIRG